tara:strand:- start:447 stop:650 length:204 start_codon:yes stop_codon:yes gene_type:complete
MGGYFVSRPLIGVKMIYYKNKEGKIIGKKSPSEEQIKIYKKEGFVECDENGNTKSKPKSKVSKAKKK